MAHNDQEQQRLNKEQMQIQLEKQKQADTAWSASTLAKEKLRTQQDYYQRQNQLTGAGSGFVQTLQLDYAKQDEDILASAPNEQAKGFMQKQLGEYRSSMLLDAAKYENDKFHSFNIQQFNAAKDSSSQSVYNDPSSYGKVFAEQSILIDASGLPDETRFKLKQQLKESMGDAYYTGSMAKPDGAKKVLEEINSFKGLSQDQQAAQQAAQMAGANPTHFLVLPLAESGHKWTHAKDKNGKDIGTASGPHQIIDKTFTGWGGDLSKKNDPAHYYQTAAKGAKKTEDEMTHLLGRAPTGGEFLGGWMLGKSDAAKVYTAENNTRLSDILSSDVIKSNGLEGKTVGEYKSEKEQRYTKLARTIIDTTNSPQVTFEQRAKIERQAEAQLTQEASLYKTQLDNQVANDSARLKDYLSNLS
jgi:hypothetical protein